MTDDQKPYDDDLTFDDVPVVPEDPRAQDDGDDFLDEVDDLDDGDLFPDEAPAEPEPGAGFAVHHGGAELFPSEAAGVVDEEPRDDAEGPTLASEDVEEEPVQDLEPVPSPMAGMDQDGPFDLVSEDDETAAFAVGDETSEGDVTGDVEGAARGDAAGSGDSFDDAFDDVFVIEFDGADAEDAGEEADEEACDPLLTPLSAILADDTVASTAPVEVEEAESVSADLEDPATGFREDRAGWLGEDMPLAELVGERGAVDGEEDVLDLFEEDSAADEDPFAIDEVELEVEDAVDGEVEDVADEPATCGVQPESLDVEDDAWAPLGDGESWVMGADLDAAAGADRGEGEFDADEADAEVSAEESLAPVFGMGRFDPTLSEDGADDAPSSDDDDVFGFDDVEAGDETEFADPIYGDVGAGIDEVEPQPYGEADDEMGLVEDDEYGDEFDETFIETEPSHGRIVGVLRGAGRSPWTKVAAALLVSLGAAGATVATMRPEWFGLVPGVVAPERVDVARPQIAVPTTEEPGQQPTTGTDSVAAETPAVAVGPETTTPAVTEQAPTIDPVAAVTTELSPAAVPSAPLVETAPVTPTPVAAPTVDRVEEPAAARPRPSLAFVGFETRDGMEIHDLTDAVPPRVSGVQVVSPGERAFAQLRNAEIFVGVVKRVEAAFVTLDLEPGEISLSRASLTTLTPLASTDATEMLAAQHGYVRLPTEARLWGQILRNSTNEDVILQTEDARIRVPRGSVVQLQGSDPARTALVESQDDSWLDARVREQLRSGGEGGPSGRR